jgi:hypothetical protein
MRYHMNCNNPNRLRKGVDVMSLLAILVVLIVLVVVFKACT